MEEVFDRTAQAIDADRVQQILDAETTSYFEDLDDNELFSRKHSREREETDAQAEALDDASEIIWGSLESLCSTDQLALPYFDTKEKQNALKLAIKDGLVNRKFIHSFIRQKWPVYLEKKGPKGKKRLKSQEYSEQQGGPTHQKRQKSQKKRQSQQSSSKGQALLAIGQETKTYPKSLTLPTTISSVGNTTEDVPKPSKLLCLQMLTFYHSFNRTLLLFPRFGF